MWGGGAHRCGILGGNLLCDSISVMAQWLDEAGTSVDAARSDTALVIVQQTLCQLSLLPSSRVYSPSYEMLSSLWVPPQDCDYPVHQVFFQLAVFLMPQFPP